MIQFFKMAVTDLKLKKKPKKTNPEQRTTGTKRRQILWYSTFRVVELLKD